MTQFFFDTEFIEDGKTIEMISLAMVSDAGKELHFVRSDCDFTRANAWVKEHVLPYLPGKDEAPWVDRWEALNMVLDFVRSHPRPYHFWAYYSAYDWVLFCQLFGCMIDLPSDFPQYCRDIMQEMDRLGYDRSQLPPNDRAHDALSDARWNKIAWEVLRNADFARPGRSW